MKLFRKQNFTGAFNALVITFAFAAMFHLILVAVVSLVKHDMSFLNPLDFLGVSILYPHYRNSQLWAGIGWTTLAVLFFTVLYLRIHYHLYIAIIKESVVGKKFTDAKKNITKIVTEKII